VLMLLIACVNVANLQAHEQNGASHHDKFALAARQVSRAVQRWPVE
jgi:hypothetical protein